MKEYLKNDYLPEVILKMAFLTYTMFALSENFKGKLRITQCVELKVMTYNIHHGNPPSRPGVIDLAAIVKTIRSEDPDIIALQEIDVNTGRSGKGNQAELIAEKLGMNVFFGKALNYNGGEYGVAILSKYPLSEEKVYKLPSASGTKGEPRVLATVKVYLNDNDAIRFGSTHLDAQKAETNRILRMQEIRNIASREDLPIVIAGDFNAIPNSEVIDLLDERFSRTCTDCDPTIPAIEPVKAIDFIAFKPVSAFRVKKHRVITENYASDHLPVVAVLKFTKQYK